MKKSKIKSFEDACKALKLNPKNLPNVSLLPKKHQKSLVAYYKLFIVVEALNEGWTPDWNDSSQPKYFPYFYGKKNRSSASGVGLSFRVCDFLNTGTDVGSRLCYKSSELAEYSGKKFIKLYEEAYLFIK